ncbi:MAG TPA: glutamine--tRNA ligase/YqeY domain fusion protein [Verrucomicrobiae bacterium]
MSLENKESPPVPSDFIRDIVAKHVAEKKYPRIHTRFPPEPNGWLHIGHAKSICLNFGIAREFGGVCNLRMDDTNPAKEDVEYVDSIIADVNWLISGWADKNLGLKEKGKTSETISGDGKRDFFLPPVVGQASRLSPSSNEIVRDRRDACPTLEPFYASDYFDQIYDYAEQLIERGKAFVCDLSAADMEFYRGAPDRPGKDSPFRNRTPEENLDLFRRMRDGEFPDGARTLRAKIDMASSNIWLRDPILYRIRHAEHHHTGAKWKIYPMYDFAHGLSDYIEGVTHSICTLEFEVHRALYDWILESLGLPRALPKQYEFARLNLSYTVLSKRKLMQLVEEKLVTGWDDPRMPTISGIRRRGVTSVALRAFAYNIGITKFNGLTDVAVLEHAIRDDLNKRALRRLAVLRPIKVVITNFPEVKIEELDAVNNPEAGRADSPLPADGAHGVTRPTDPNDPIGIRKIPFSRELFIERDDFQEIPPPKFFRLKPGGEVRLKYAYVIKCDEVVKDASGNITELRCTADLDSKTGGATSARKVKGTIHWVSAAHAVDAEVRLYERLFTEAEPEKDGRDFKSVLNPRSLEVITAKLEPSLKDATFEARYQFERLAYFALDKDSGGKLIFNRTITLKDTWAKEAQKR